MGYDYVLLQDIKATKFPNKKLNKRVIADFSDATSLLNSVESIDKKIDGVLTIYENYVVATAIIADHLGLPGMSIESAIACTDKYIMRSLFANSPKKISPDFAEVKIWEDAVNFANNHDFPIILKPANLAKSLLVFKNHTIEELEVNFKKMTSSINEVYAKYSPLNSPKIVIEEFMEGPIHSVDAFVDAKGFPHVLEQVVDYQTGYDIGYDDNFHYSRILPSELSRTEIASIRDTASMGCQALGMKSSPAHIEIIRTKSGPMIVEIGARNGGYRERMYSLANGINTVANAINLALNRPLSLESTKNEACAVLELFPKEKGIFKGIKNEETLKNLHSLNYYAVKQKIDTIVGKSSDGFKMCSIIILHNNNSEKFRQDLEYINQNVSVLIT